MREIKFRGKLKDNGEWVYGGLATYGEHAFIIITKLQISESDNIYFSTTGIEVDPSTVGQYTGLKDKNGKEICEGDIVKVTDDNDEISELNSDTGIGAIEWLDKWGFWNISRIENSLGDINNSYDIEVIGNIHDNPEQPSR